MAVQTDADGRELIQTVEPALFKELLARWASGVTVVTVREGDVVHGMTASSFSSVSVDPPLVLVCLYRGTRTREQVLREGRFAINILSAEQRDVAERFAGRRPAGESPFEGIDWECGEGGCPLIDRAIVHLECEVEDSHEAGTHTIVVGRVASGRLDKSAEPLLYWARDFQALEKDQAPLRKVA
jgi:flavin reductase (DIM6/NTAB) family NADH-FMN oxidoreductase RutF